MLSGGRTRELPQMPTNCTLTWMKPGSGQVLQTISSDTRYVPMHFIPTTIAALLCTSRLHILQPGMIQVTVVSAP